MRAVDTDLLVRIVTRDDLGQAQSADRFIENGAWVSLVALAETTWVLRSVYGLTANEVAKAVEMLQKHRDLTLQDSEIVGAALDTFRKKPALRFTDCLLLELARKAGYLPLGTFDRNLGKLKGAEKL